jgi:hypothetical protein
MSTAGGSLAVHLDNLPLQANLAHKVATAVSSAADDSIADGIELIADKALLVQCAANVENTPQALFQICRRCTRRQDEQALFCVVLGAEDNASLCLVVVRRQP